MANEVGRKPPTFLDASKVANELIQLDYTSGKIVFNRFKYFLSTILKKYLFYFTQNMCLLKGL